MNYFKNLVVALTLVLAMGTNNVQAGFLDSIFGPSAEEKKEYQRQTVDVIREKVLSRYKKPRILSYRYLDSEDIQYVNGMNAKLVTSVMGIDSSDYGQRYVVIVTLFEQREDKYVYNDFQSDGFAVEDYSYEAVDKLARKLVQLAKEGLVANNHIYASS